MFVTVFVLSTSELVCTSISSEFVTTSIFVVFELSVSVFVSVSTFCESTICLILSIPCELMFSNAKSRTNTIAAIISTTTITATVLFASCLGVGQITLFNSALKSLKKCFLFLVSFLAFLSALVLSTFLVSLDTFVDSFSEVVASFSNTSFCSIF